MRIRSGGRSPGQLTLGFDEDPRSIARCLIAVLRAEHPTATLIPELGLAPARARIDLAQVSLSRLSGYEIKGRRDDLDRLPHQAIAFSAVFDHVSLVVAACHATHAQQMIPSWWGVAVATDQLIDWVRQPESNPGVRPEAVASLLWRDEAAALARELSGRASRGTRSQLIETLTLQADPEWLSAGVRSALRRRTGWRSAA
jgi:hypothetical protein